jgi:hypothetical protein
MPHPCANQWKFQSLVNRVAKLADLVDAENDRQVDHGCVVGGWGYWLVTLQDFERFRMAYIQVCRALNTSTVPPGEWAPGLPSPPPPPPPPVNMAPISAAVSLKIGNASQAVLDVLAIDEVDLEGTGLPVHPGLGLPGWLGTGQINPSGYADVERLFTSVRNALDR